MLSIEQAIKNFLADLAVGQSAQTVETYSQGMRRFQEYLEQVGTSSEDPASRLSVNEALGCAQWLTAERESGVGRLAKATLRTYLASISQLYSYLLREKVIELSASEMERMRTAYRSYRRGYSRRLPKLPPEDAVQALLDAARQVQVAPKNHRQELARLRNIAILETLRSSGMRVGELVGLKRDNLDYLNQSASVTGKGDKQRVVYFDDAAWQAIETYLKARADGAKGRALYQLPLFARHDRRSGNRTLPLTTEAIRQIFSALVEAASLEIGMTPHSLRHAFATRLLEVTGDLALVQDMLGHSSPATTRIYAKVSSKRMRDAHKSAFGYKRKDKHKDEPGE